MRDGRIEVHVPVNATVGDLSKDELASKSPHILFRHFSRTELKLKEAAYFLRLLREHTNSESALLYHLDAFAQSFRAITWALQKEAAHVLGFNEWYQREQESMRRNTFMSAMNRLRTVSSHEGLEIPEKNVTVRVRIRRDGTQELDFPLDKVSVEGVILDNAMGEFDEAMNYMQRMVAEAVTRGFLPVPAPRNVQLQPVIMLEKSDGTWTRRA